MKVNINVAAWAAVVIGIVIVLDGEALVGWGFILAGAGAMTD